MIYTRYSKVHQNSKTFYGLRDCDLKLLEGHPSVICFLWENQNEPLLIPYSDFEEIFNSISPASDGQYKVQIYFESNGTELYIPTIGRFGIDFYYGWHILDDILDSSSSLAIPELNHSQIQTLIGSIGFQKNFDIWIPQNDRSSLDWKIAPEFQIKNAMSSDLQPVKKLLKKLMSYGSKRIVKCIHSLRLSIQHQFILDY